ncbi:MAG: hypothetical protein ABEJ22_01715 [Haloferacaceae archaeon]
MDAPTFRKRDTFECDAVTAVAGGDVLAVGTGGGEVVIASATGTSRTALDADVVDVAAGSRVYVATADGVFARSVDGTGVWNREFDGVARVAATGDGLLGVLLEDDTFLGVDGETGAVRFEFERPHADIAEPPSVVAHGSGFLFGVWSFVVGVDDRGDVTFETNLDGAIQSLGVVADCAVVSMRNDRLVGLDRETGEQRWTYELTTRALSDRGEEWLLATTADATLALTPDGSTAEVDTLPAERAVPTVDGDLVAVVKSDTIAVYRLAHDAVDVEIPTDALVRERSATRSLTVRNGDDSPVAATLEFDLSNGSVKPISTPLSLAPGEETSVDVELTPESDAPATLDVRVDGYVAATETLSVRERPVLDPTASLERVDRGTVTVALAGLPGDPVAVASERSTLAEGVTDAATTVDLPWRRGETTLTVSTAYDEVDLDVTFPDFEDALALDGSEDSLVAVRCSNPSPVAFADDLTLSGSAMAEPVSRTVTLDPEETVRVLVQPPAAGRLVVGFASVPARVEATVGDGGARRDRTNSGGGTGRTGRSGQTDRARQTDRRARPDETAQPGGADRSSRTGKEQRDRHASGDPDGRSPRSSGDERVPRVADEDSSPPPHDETGETSAEPTREAGAEPTREASTEPTEGVGAGPTGEASTEPNRRESSRSDPRESDARRPDSRESDSPESGHRQSESDRPPRSPARESHGDAGASVTDAQSAASLAVSREVNVESVAAGTAFRERLVVENETGSGVVGRVESGEETVEFDPVPSGERRTFERLHAFYAPGTKRLPPVTVRTSDGRAVEAADLEVEVTEATVAIESSVIAGETPAEFDLAVTNHGETPQRIERVGIEGVDVWSVDGREVPPNRAAEWSTAVEEPIERTAGVLAGAVELSRDGDRYKRPVLIPVEAGERDAEVALEVSDETKAIPRGMVVLTLRNDGGRPLDRVRITADGEAVSDLMYRGTQDVDGLDPGESVTHHVDLGPVTDRASLTVTVEYDGEEATYGLDGPIVEDVAEWTEDHRAEWTVERPDDGDDDADERDHLLTGYRSR